MAAERRLNEELGLSATLDYLYQFEYQARYATLGSENELCSVYIGNCSDDPTINREEIADWCWIDPAQLTQRLQREPDEFTPWLHLEWQRLTGEFAHRLAQT